MSLTKKDTGFTEEEIEVLFSLIQKIRKNNLKVVYGLENMPEKNEIDQIAIILNNKFRALSNPKDPKNLTDNIRTIFNTQAGIENKIARYPSIRTLEALSSFYYEEYPEEIYEWNDTTYKLLSNWKRFKEEFYEEQRSGPVPVYANFTETSTGQFYAGSTYTPSSLPNHPESEEVIPPRLFGINLLRLRSTNLALFITLSVPLMIGFYLIYNVLKDNPFYINNSLSFQTETAFINLATVLLFILLHETQYFGFKGLINRLEGKTIVDASLKQFQGGWLAILISLLFFYLWLTTKYICYDLFNLKEPENLALATRFNLVTNTLSDFFHLTTGFFYLYLYHILDLRSISTAEHPERSREFRRSMVYSSLAALFIFVFTTLGRFYDWKVFIMVYSLFSVVAMSMFFSRLNSQLMDDGRAFIPVFYTYAAVQAGYPYLTDMYDIRGKVVIAAVLVFKIFLFSVINSYMQRGRFRKYFESIR